jgi:Ala-tRNA(Pro) deacylase
MKCQYSRLPGAAHKLCRRAPFVHLDLRAPLRTYTIPAMSPFDKITEFLKQSGAVYQLEEHEPVYTSEQAATISGTELEQGAKALLFKAKSEFVLAVLPGHKKVDFKKLKNLLGIKDLRFATPEEVISVMGCEIGACYPFGNLIGVRMIVDQSLSSNQLIAFNPGVHDRSIILNYEDYARAVEPELADVAQ